MASCCSISSGTAPRTAPSGGSWRARRRSSPGRASPRSGCRLRTILDRTLVREQPARPDVILYSHRFLIDRFLSARRAYGFGEQEEYFDHPNTIGWTRLGTGEHPGAMAVVMTNGSAGDKWMNVY